MKVGVRGPKFGVRALSVAFATGVLLSGVLAFAAEPRATLTVLFTSDMHANVLPFDEVRERPTNGSVAQVATLVARVRRENSRIIVLDGGDAIQGTPLGYYAIAAPGATGPDPTISAMNLVGYDAAVPGNHEFNFGEEVLRRSLQQSRFRWLAANLSGGAEARLPIAGEIVLSRGGVRVAVLGLTNPNVPHWEPASHWAGLSFSDPLAVAAARVPELRRRADVVIVVVHSGFERDPDTGAPDESDDENFAWRLAQLDGIDLLLTGHTHHDVPPRVLGKTVVAQPGRWAELVTRVDLDLQRNGRGWRVAGWRGENLKSASETADPGIVAAVTDAEARVKSEFSRPIGRLTAPLKVIGLPTGDEPSVDLIHAVQLDATGAQLSLAAPLRGGLVQFPAGVVTPRLAYALYPYPNTLVVVRLTGTQLKDVVEHAVRGWVGVECGGGSTRLLREPSVAPYNFDTIEGATYLVDPTAPVGARIRGLRVGGRPVRGDETFTVVVNSYRAAGGGSYPHLPGAPRVTEVDRTMFDLLVEYIGRHAPITPAADENWSFTVPLGETVAPRASAAR